MMRRLATATVGAWPPGLASGRLLPTRHPMRAAVRSASALPTCKSSTLVELSALCRQGTGASQDWLGQHQLPEVPMNPIRVASSTDVAPNLFPGGVLVMTSEQTKPARTMNRLSGSAA
jgi:hypothetical protein